MKTAGTVGVGLLVAIFGVVNDGRAVESRAATSHVADLSEAKKLIDGMLVSLRSLSSGVVELRGRESDHNVTFGEIEHEVEIFTAFDLSERRFRFNRKSKEWHFLKGGAEKSQPVLRQFARAGQINGMYSRTPERVYRFIEDQSRPFDSPLLIYDNDKPPLKKLEVFDCRILPLCSHGDLLVGTSFEALEKSLLSQRITKLSRINNNVYRVDLEIQTGNMAGSLAESFWIDTSKGFSPVRHEYADVKRPMAKIVKELDWQRIRDVWVPKRFRIEDKMNELSAPALEFTLVWQSVNQIVAPVLFEELGFGLPDGTPVLDARLGEPIHVRTIGGRILNHFTPLGK